MPLYEFTDRNTGEKFSKFMKWEERQRFLEDNQNLRPIICAPKIVSGVGDGLGGGLKVPDLHRDIVSEIKKTHTKHNIRDH